MGAASGASCSRSISRELDSPPGPDHSTEDSKAIGLDSRICRISRIVRCDGQQPVRRVPRTALALDVGTKLDDVDSIPADCANAPVDEHGVPVVQRGAHAVAGNSDHRKLPRRSGNAAQPLDPVNSPCQRLFVMILCAGACRRSDVIDWDRRKFLTVNDHSLRRRGSPAHNVTRRHSVT